MFLHNQFLIYTDFPFQFCIFSAKSPSVTQRSVSQENDSKKSKHPLPFLHETKGSNNSFILVENNFRFLRKIAKFEYKVTVHYGLWQNASSCDPLNYVRPYKKPQYVSCSTCTSIFAHSYFFFFFLVTMYVFTNCYQVHKTMIQIDFSTSC